MLTEVMGGLKKTWPFLAGAILIIGLGFLAGGELRARLFEVNFFENQPDPGENFSPNNENQEIKFVRIIDGVEVTPDKENLLPIAVMIENHPDSRPSAGLSRASLVYEAEAEGGITRFLAVFADTADIPKIGPIRSARPYYVRWAGELQSLYVHCGGSPEALLKISREDINDLNEFYNAGSFWREPSRPAPHNVYTSGDKLAEYITRKKIENKGSEEIAPFKYKKEAPEADRPESSEITVFFKGNDFTAGWKYDKLRNDYARTQTGEAQLDEDRSEIRAKNVILRFVQSAIIDDYGRREITDIGEGKAKVCSDGKCAEAVWKKEDKNSKTAYFNGMGAEIELNAGITWVEVVPIGYAVKIE
ncbi:MAG: DUF3048 domain-containing protein [Patescibacteria group bacterium]|jgi:hypothetical protein